MIRSLGFELGRTKPSEEGYVMLGPRLSVWSVVCKTVHPMAAAAIK